MPEEKSEKSEKNGSPYSLAALGRRIDLNVQSGWGLEKGTQAQLNLLSLYCQKHELLPGDDVTLYEGRPWITIDGRVKLMRRNPQFKKFENRPLSKDEKALWGYEPDDLVVECTIHLRDGTTQSARGKVSAAERTGQGAGRLSPVARIHPVEMAEKRAIARAERFTFGTESFVDDEEVEDAARVVIQEREDPERVRAQAARYTEIHGTEDDDSPVRMTKAELWRENRRLSERAAELGLRDAAVLNSRAGEEEIAAANAQLLERIENLEIDQTLAQETLV